MDSFPTLALIPTFGPIELLVIGIGMLLFFGRWLPKAMRNLGRGIGWGIAEFKREVRGIGDQVDQAAPLPPQQPRYEQPVRPAPSQAAAAAPLAAAPLEAAAAPEPRRTDKPSGYRYL